MSKEKVELVRQQIGRLITTAENRHTRRKNLARYINSLDQSELTQDEYKELCFYAGQQVLALQLTGFENSPFMQIMEPSPAARVRYDFRRRSI